jgi:hypothetical protein
VSREYDPWEGIPPLQAMITEVLTARLRLGEQSWPFPARCKQALEALAGQGLLTYERDSVARTLRARLTHEGRHALLTSGYKAPLAKLAEDALFLRQNGERAPGGHETWGEWEARAEQVLRSTYPGTDGERDAG